MRTDPNRTSGPDFRNRLPRTRRTRRTNGTGPTVRVNPHGSRRTRMYERSTRIRPKRHDTRRRPTPREWAWIWATATTTTLTAAILTATGVAR